jgi:UDP-N-acetylmuramoyl-L-alanyl-D-glutamate--2,6-diaminopimelate ligase
LKAKLSIAKELEIFSGNCGIIVNKDDKESEKFLALDIKYKIPYSINDATNVKVDEKGSSFQIGKTVIHSKLPGIFNVSNMLGAAACARFLGIGETAIKQGLESAKMVRGRMEKINQGQEFDVVVDYAHTPDSLRAVYETYKKHRTICVLGNTGGGRDRWKRPEMGKIADEYCDHIILTNEDPYDENPVKIVDEVRAGIKTKPVEIIMDRREAIRRALEKAHSLRLASLAQADQNRIAVLITGKGTDPYIMGPKGTKQEWDDAQVVREELYIIMNKES